MINNVAELEEGSVLRTDVAVVGAGLAGIDLARYLGRQGIRVILLESGRLQFDPAIQELNRVRFAGKPLRTPETDGHISSYLAPMYRGIPRLRQFGGTTNLWTGKWRIFDPWDFQPRPWIPHSGWPIDLDDLLPFHRETAQEYGLGDIPAEAGRPAFERARRLLAPHGLEPHLFYWEKTPTRAGPRFFEELKKSATIDVWLDGTATEIQLHDDLRTVRCIRFRSIDGRSFTLCANRFVLATGGLEVPRLLLASNRQLPAGIGNERDLVGRFYMDHPKHMQGTVRPGRGLKPFVDGLRTQPRPRFGMTFSLSEAAQRDLSLPNHVIFMRPVAYTRFGPIRHYAVKLGIEQTPCAESRVFLDSETDALGMPRLVVDWRFNAFDRTAFALLQQKLKEAFAAARLGTLDLGPRPLVLDEMMDASHHMGTTRMAADPHHGVVDADCRVHGTENLYVASSAVFPTAHGYSPTFSILAIARRLGTHLAQQYAARERLAVATPGASDSIQALRLSETD